MHVQMHVEAPLICLYMAENLDDAGQTVHVIAIVRILPPTISAHKMVTITMISTDSQVSSYVLQRSE